MDKIDLQGLAVDDFGFWNYSDTHWAFMENWNGSMGFGGDLTSPSSFFGTLCSDQKLPQHRFGIATNATNATIATGNGVLIMGGVDLSLLADDLSVVPLDWTRENRTIQYAGNIGHWWVRGDVVIIKNGTEEVVFRNHSMYLDIGAKFVSSFMVR